MTSSPLILLIPGQLPVTNLATTGPTQLMVDVPYLAPQICISLVPQNCAGILGPLDGIGVYVTDFQEEEALTTFSAASASLQYSQLQPAIANNQPSFAAENYHFLGYVSMERPSIQPRLPSVMKLNTAARFGFSLEPIATLRNASSSPTSSSSKNAIVNPFPSAPSSPSVFGNATQQEQQPYDQQQWAGHNMYGFNTSYTNAHQPFSSSSLLGRPSPHQQHHQRAIESPAAVKIGKAIVSHLHTFLTSYAKTFSVHNSDLQSCEAVYLPPNWEDAWFAKFVSKRDSGAYNGE